MKRCHDRLGHARLGRLRARLWRLAAATGLLCVLGTWGAVALARASAAPADFSLVFNTQVPSSLAAIRLHILYKDPQNPNDPNSPPPPLTSVTIKAPPGSVIDGSAVPACGASDQQLMVEGRSACPAGSVVGGGFGSVIVGAGPAVTTDVLNATLINYGEGIIELFTDPSTGATVADDRAQFQGPSTMVLHPPVDPGVTEREFSFTYDAVRGPSGKAFITTPPQCAASGLWTSTLDYTVSNGASYSVMSATPCANSAHPPGAKHPRKKQHRKPKKPKHKSSAAFTG